MSSKLAAQVLVDKFISYGIEYIFCVPGASIDPILNVLKEIDSPKLILCHHESTAGYMATAYGKITGKPAVVMATAGPGATNLVSSIATAHSEHAPLIAITGQMDSKTTYKPSHQIIDAEDMFHPISKWSIEVRNINTLEGIWDFAYQTAIEKFYGPVHIAIASDLLKTPIEPSSEKIVSTLEHKLQADIAVIKDAADLIKASKRPLIMAGGGIANEVNAKVIRELVKSANIPVIATFEGAGVLSRELEHKFMGRLGVFQNQPCDELIKLSDLIITIGYNVAELDPLLWSKNHRILHIDDVSAIVGEGYRPILQVLGDIKLNLTHLLNNYDYVPDIDKAYIDLEVSVRSNLAKRFTDYNVKPEKVHPLQIIHDLKQVVTDDNTIVTDVGSHQYWMSEYFYTYKPRYFLSSMGFQTMGVSLPFAIASALVRPQHKVFSVSGDGSFLMCLMELATAVKLNLPLVHLVWKDTSFNLVEIQEVKKYGCSSGAVFGSNIDFAMFAKSFGAIGITVTRSEELLPALKEAIKANGPVIIDILVDYSDNHKIVNA